MKLGTRKRYGGCCASRTDRVSTPLRESANFAATATVTGAVNAVVAAATATGAVIVTGATVAVVAATAVAAAAAKNLSEVRLPHRVRAGQCYMPPPRQASCPSLAASAARGSPPPGAGGGRRSTSAHGEAIGTRNMGTIPTRVQVSFLDWV
eukprot:CAMPEP_0173318666 /NCGR_PEP_ID=MMETSP1143-20121109/27786_1 /TAXON_ID=483371 /ORGANISM="non described non described, Strain CCMP2298" /LENGTH=150 /DNA_ID=CAMNT_0014261941 /DNA_START=710 /DNA_END=1163 /DNA_ORIENTATION=+